MVEDYSDLRGLIGEILGEAGYQVLLAEGDLRALEVARMHRHKIRVLITDIRMARMACPELGRRLEIEHPGLRIIFMSGDPYPGLGSVPGASRPNLR